MEVFGTISTPKERGRIRWEPEHQKAFKDIKTYLLKPTIILPPMRDKIMKLYISTQHSTIGSMLAQEDDDGVESAIILYRVLNDTKTRYKLREKLYLSLYFSCIKPKYCIKSTYMFVYSYFNIIKHILSKPTLHSRIGK